MYKENKFFVFNEKNKYYNRYFYPKDARLLKRDDFLSILRLYSWNYFSYFKLYLRLTYDKARLGLIISKKVIPYAVKRNYICRLAREIFRVRRMQLHGFDILLRMQKNNINDLYNITRVILYKSLHVEITNIFNSILIFKMLIFSDNWYKL